MCRSARAKKQWEVSAGDRMERGDRAESGAGEQCRGEENVNRGGAGHRVHEPKSCTTFSRRCEEDSVEPRGGMERL